MWGSRRLCLLQLNAHVNTVSITLPKGFEEARLSEFCLSSVFPPSSPFTRAGGGEDYLSILSL